MSDLKPCPFCGKTILETLISPTNGNKRYVRCSNPSCRYGACSRKKDRESGWNTRPIEDKLQAEIESLNNGQEVMADAIKYKDLQIEQLKKGITNALYCLHDEDIESAIGVLREVAPDLVEDAESKWIDAAGQ